MKESKTKVVSLRIPIPEFIQLAYESEQKSRSVAESLLSTWRERNEHVPIDTRLRQIELAIAELRTDSTHKFQRLADGLNQIILERR